MKMRKAKGKGTSVRNAAGMWRVLMALTILCVGVAYLGPATAVAELQFEEVGTFLSVLYPSDWAQWLATDGLGNWVLVCAGTIGGDSDIFFSVSADDGATWSDLAPLNSNAATDTGGDGRVEIVYGQDTWIAAWQSSDDLSGLGMDIGDDADILYSRLEQWDENGIIWSDPAPLHDTAATDKSKMIDWGPRLAANSLGVCIAKWQRNGVGPAENLGTKLARSDDDGATWTELPNEVSNPSETFAYGQGKWIRAAGGRDEAGNKYIFMSSSPDGLTWSPLPALPADYIGAWHPPTLAGDDWGNWVLVYLSPATYEDPMLLKTTRSTNNGLDWSVPDRLNPDPALDPAHYDVHPYVATDGQGNWVAVWDTFGGLGGNLGDDGDILYSESADNGATWSVPAPVNGDAYTDTVDDELPQVAWGLGSWVVAWRDSQGVVHVARASSTPPEPVPGITAEPAVGLYTTESGGTATFTVTLDTAPADVVTVTLSSDNPNEGTVYPTALSFDASTWDIPQGAAVTGVDDFVIDGDQTYSVNLTATSTDLDYNGLEGTLTIVNRDDDNRVIVDSIAYALVRNGKDLEVTVTVVDKVGTPVAGASVAADMYLNDVVAASFDGVTGADGTVVFTRRNAKSGTYTTTVTSVVADGFTWDGVTPPNSCTK